MPHRSILGAIGNTPLVELTHLSPKREVRIFAKLEGQNPTGSVKDRIALAMVEDAEARGLLTPGMTLVEATTGNTGIALTLVARQKGYGVKLAVPENVIPGIGQMLQNFGAEIVWTEGMRGIRGATEVARALGAAPGHYHTDQFGNPANVQAHYDGTGGEILRDLPEVDVFVAGLGTGGTMTGVGRRLREHNPEVQLLAVEPHLGMQLQGLKSMQDGFIPAILDLGLLDGKILVRSGPAFHCSRLLVAREGIFAGISSGAALHGALRWAERMDSGNIVVLFADGGWKYLGGGPFAEPLHDEESEGLDDIIWW